MKMVFMLNNKSRIVVKDRLKCTNVKNYYNL